jgi:protein TonB
MRDDHETRKTADAVEAASPDALVSFSDFLLERFGLVATMQVAIVGSIAFHVLAIVGLGFKLPVAQVRRAAQRDGRGAGQLEERDQPEKADALAQANLDGGGNTDQKLRAQSPFPPSTTRDPSRELQGRRARMRSSRARRRS